jgi:hypothetical protein
MKKPFAIIGLLLMGWSLGCQTIQPAPLPTLPAPIRITLSPSVSYWQQAIHDCSLSGTDWSALVDIVQKKNIHPDQTDLIIQSGDSAAMNLYALGTDQVVLIVNPENPISSLTTDQVKGIYTGFLQTWGTVQSGLSEDWGKRSIRPLVYFEGDDFQSIFKQNYMADENIQPEILAAPSPADIIKIVMSDNTAIGFIPQKWLISSVKTIQFEKTVSFHMTISLQKVPTEPEKKLIACLQSKTK